MTYISTCLLTRVSPLSADSGGRNRREAGEGESDDAREKQSVRDRKGSAEKNGGRAKEQMDPDAAFPEGGAKKRSVEGPAD